MGRSVPFFVKPGHADALAARGLTSLEACRTFRADRIVKAIVPGRTTASFVAEGRTYFLKCIVGAAAAEIPHEAALLGQLGELHQPVAEVVAVGAEPDFAAMITVGLPIVGTLEDRLCRGEPDPVFAARAAVRLAGMLRALHATGVAHRDCYLGHVLVGRGGDLYWTDFGRASQSVAVSLAARVKDLAGLDFSTPPRVASDRMRLRFLRRYLGNVSRLRWRLVAWLVRGKARRMRRHAERQIARGRTNVHVNT